MRPRATPAALRLATDADNAAVLELFSAVPMAGDLVLSAQRSPEFFALYRMQGGSYETWVVDGEGGGLDAVGSILVRDGFLAGQPAKVGYLGDLRVRFGASRRRALSRFYGPTLRGAAERHGCHAFLTAVLASNAAALNALVRRTRSRQEQPEYRLLRRYTTTSIQFATRRRGGGGPSARLATAADLPALRARLAADHARREFGYRFDQGELEHRLRSWPGFSLDRTYLVEGRDGAVLACATAWDPAAVKRFRVEAYRRRMRWIRRLYNAAATVGRFVPLPPAQEEFRYFYLCNLSVEGDDPALFSALLSRIYEDLRPRGYHFFSFYLDEDDPLRPALRGFWTRELAFHLYGVSPDGAFPALGPGRLGFELALA